MADVRAVASYSELSPFTATFKIDGTTVTYTPSNYDGTNHSAQVGKAVSLVADSTIGLGAAAAWTLGKLIKVESDGFATVQYGGVMALPYVVANPNPPLIGRGVQGDGAGNVISPAGGVRLATERGTVISLDAVNQLAYVAL